MSNCTSTCVSRDISPGGQKSRVAAFVQLKQLKPLLMYLATLTQSVQKFE